MRITRLDLGSLHVVNAPWPVHGFVVHHPELGAVLIDTGCGGPESLLREYRVVNRSVADALAEHDLSPSDVRVVVNSHLHFDHCGQNAVFEHTTAFVQRAELERVRRENGDVHRWLEAAGARFELLDGEVTLAPGLRVVPTPGHTSGHQSAIVASDDGLDVFVGDAAFTHRVWDDPDLGPSLPGQTEDVAAWRRSFDALHALAPARVHFCHDASVGVDSPLRG